LPASLAQTSLDAIKVLDPIKALVRNAEGKKRDTSRSRIGMERKIRIFFPDAGRYPKTVLIASPAYRFWWAKILPIDRYLLPSTFC
jgi:hypothetical protein